MAAPPRVAESVLQLMIQEMVASVERSMLPEAEAAGPEAAALAVHAKLDAQGYDVGFRFIERVAQQRLIASEPLEAIKFVCKDLWSELYGKPIDKLQTNHRGVFVIRDNNFKLTSRHSSKSDVAAKQSQLKYIKFPCGLIRGALANLGYAASVTADVETAEAGGSTSFHVRLLA